MEHNLSYHEIVPDQTFTDTWKEINLNTGGTQSTLQDIKVTEKANGYSYRNSSHFYTRNRFIYWRINNDVLEIVEQSLDINLNGNHVRYKFVNSPILDGVTAHETEQNVIILVPTVCSVHKLIFPHPSALHQQEELFASHPDLSVPSIFAEANVLQARDPSTFYVFSHPTANSQLPHLAASLLIDDEAMFLLAYPTNEIILIKQYPNGESDIIELKHETLVPRFLAEIAEKFRSKTNDSSNVAGMILHKGEQDTYAITVSYDGYLRLWSCTRGILVGESDLLQQSNRLLQGAQCMMLKKVQGDNDDDEEELLLTVYVHGTNDSKFFILAFKETQSSFPFQILSYLSPPCTDIVDYAFTRTHVYTMWRERDGECQVYSAKVISSIGQGAHWVPSILENPPDHEELPYNSDYIDPKEAYLSYIFYPGRFHLSIINKALNVYKKSLVGGTMNLSGIILKQRVCIAVENKIQSTLEENEVNDEEYLECANICWRDFYSCCIQYHTAGLRPMGMLLLPSVSGIVLLKRSMYSFLRPLDTLEHLYLCSNYISNEQMAEMENLFSMKKDIADVMDFLEILTYMDRQLNDLFKIVFEEKMENLNSPEAAVEQLFKEIDFEEMFTPTIRNKLQNIPSINNALQHLLHILTMEFDECNASETNLKPTNSSGLHLFNSQLGISFCAELFKQQTYFRFSLCRVILSFIHGQERSIDAARYRPHVVHLTSSYFMMYWLSKQTALPVLPLETALQRLSPLKLNPVFNLRTTNMQGVLLMVLYIGSSGGAEAHRTLLSNEEALEPQWHSSLLEYMRHLRRILWPDFGNSMFAEWLLTSGQHLLLEQFVHLMGDWCQSAKYTRYFLLAAAHLVSGQHYKAYDMFKTAAHGIEENYITRKIQQSPTQSFNPIILYYLKVIHLFELHGGQCYALELAEIALEQITGDEPLMATLYSIMFKHHLALGHYEKAYDALYANPDAERRKDNLRELVKTLLENKELTTLMSFKYKSMESVFCNILFARARACDSVDNIYYDILYCYQIKRGLPLMRLAGAVMYEQAFRLKYHNTIQALERQVKCYLAAVNSLSLCDPKYAWVLIPSNPEMPENIIHLPEYAETNDEPEVLRLKTKIDIIELKAIKQELSLSCARLRLAKFDTQYLTNSTATPQEIVMYLTMVGLFKPALSLCTEFDMPMDPIFNTLTRQCILLTEYEDVESWNWLVENNLHELPILGRSPSCVAWMMLQTFLDEYEKENCTSLLRIVCEKIIRMSSHIPQWLLASYKKRNPAELLRLYINNGRLREASDLAKDHILAALGHGYDHFGFEPNIGTKSRSLCLPVHVIDFLIYELQLQNETDDGTPPPLKNEYVELKELFLKYLETTARVSNEICRTAK